MPTTIIKTLGNGGAANGYDYGNFNDFAAAIPANLVTADQQWILEVYATHGEISLTTTQTISGKTTDATRNIIIRAAAGQSFNDHANKATNALRYNASNGAAITNNSNAGWLVVNDWPSVARVEGLQFKHTNTTQHTLINVNEGVIDKCIFQSEVMAYQNGVIRCGQFINSLAYALSNTGSTKFMLRLAWNGSTSKCVGSTIWTANGTTATAIAQPAGGAEISNCAIFGFSAAFTNTGTAGTFSPTYCATNLSGIGGSNNQESLTATDQFENLTTNTWDFRVKAGAALINAGSRAETYTGDLDVLEQSRSTTTPTIGAFEFGAGGGDTDATAPGTTLSGTATLTPGAATGGTVIDGAADGATLAGTASLTPGAATGGSSGSFSFDPCENNTQSGVLDGVAVNWTWHTGAVGAVTAVTNGSGTITTSGMTASGLPAGVGYGVLRTADGTVVAYQEGTVS